MVLEAQRNNQPTLELGEDDAFPADEFVTERAAEPLFHSLPEAPLEIARVVLSTDEDCEPPPFDAPEEDDEIFQARRVEPHDDDSDGELLLVNTGERTATPPLPARANAEGEPLPPITIHAGWDRAEIAEALFASLTNDPRMRRTTIVQERGGLASAAARCKTGRAPDLFLIDTARSRAEILEDLDALAPAIASGSKVVVIGAVNDITLLRDLTARGVSEYIVPPLLAEDFIRTLCRLYAHVDNSRVLAVIGARGGIGASTIAHNIAWSIAERQQSNAAIVDLDLSFGTAAFNFHSDAPRSIAEALKAPARANPELLDAVAVKPRAGLQVFSAPLTLDPEFNVTGQALAAVIARVRRTTSNVVLDLPHLWTSWIKDTLLRADEVLIVAGPDLASLSSAKGMLEALKAARPDIAPLVALSMVGVPKRPEIALKDFTAALGVEPVATFAFDPDLLGKASLSGQMIGEVAPTSKMAASIDALATALTGHEPIAPVQAKPAPAPKAPPPKPAAPPVFDESGQGVLQRLRAARRRTSPANDNFIAQARAVAYGEPEAPRQRTSRTLRAAVAMTTLIVATAAQVESHRSQANAAEPAVAPMTAPPTSAAPAAPDPAVLYAAALRLLAEGDTAQGLAHVRDLAESGYPPAQYRLAKLYETGAGVRTDLTQARRWTERAALGGEPQAMHDLAVYFARGEGGPVDATAAFRWFRQAAELGVADSQYNLGVLYEQGRGVTADSAEALFWFSLAAHQGDEAAAARAAVLETRLSPMYAEQARARVAAFTSR